MEQSVGSFAPQLYALVALAAHDGHMTRAARALEIPQSSMSRRIHTLESELKIPLLIRSGRTVRLTPAAHRLAEAMRAPLHALDLAIDHEVGTADPYSGTVRFGFPLTMSSGRVSDLLSAFRFSHPRINVTLKQAHGMELSDDLEAGRLDLAIMIPPPDRLPHRMIGAQIMLAALPDNHRFADRDEISLEELRNDTFVVNPPSYHLRQQTELWCAEAGFMPRVSVEVTEFTTQRELIARGMGVGVLPHNSRKPIGMVEVPLNGHYSRHVALASGTRR